MNFIRLYSGEEMNLYWTLLLMRIPSKVFPYQESALLEIVLAPLLVRVGELNGHPSGAFHSLSDADIEGLCAAVFFTTMVS